MDRGLLTTDATLSHFVRQIGRRRGTVVRTRLGANVAGDREEWLVARPEAFLTAQGGDAHFVVIGSGAEPDFTSAIDRGVAMWQSPNDRMILVLGVGAAAGRAAGVCLSDRTDAVAGRMQVGDGSPRLGLDPLDYITIVGAGIRRIALHGRPNGAYATPPTGRETRPAGSAEFWSRTIGALTREVWQRLTELRVAIVGCGRSGSLVASHLCRTGVQSITLVDSDRVESHNVGEMDGVKPTDVGRPKVKALADCLVANLALPGGDVRIIPHSVVHLAALDAIKTADVIISCVDNAAARLATAVLSALYLRPLVDIGTGIHFARPTRPDPGADYVPARRRRLMGADVRLVLPDRCPACFGGIAELDRGRSELLRIATLDSRPASPPREWNQERAGSLRSLNGLAVNLAMRLVEDFVGGRVAASRWFHLEFSDDGTPTVEIRTAPVPTNCPICRAAGRGDEGLRSIPAILQSIVRHPGSLSLVGSSVFRVLRSP